jgi:hypothetical protein
MLRTQKQGCRPRKYPRRRFLVAILLFGLIIPLCCSLGPLHDLRLSSTKFLFERLSSSQFGASERHNIRRSTGGFEFSDPYTSPNGTIWRYAQFNPSISTKRERVKRFLTGTDFGQIQNDGESAEDWMSPYLSPGFDLHISRFLLLSKRWLGFDDFQPQMLPDLIRKVQKPLEENAAYWSTENLTDHDSDKWEGKTRYSSCAVVVNSGILYLNKTHGEDIDNHEIVIRLNNASNLVGMGMDKYVGSKTDISLMSSTIFKSHSRMPHCWWHRYGREVPIVLYIRKASHLVLIARCAPAPGVYTMIVTHSRFDALCGAIAKWYSLTAFVRFTGEPVNAWDSAHDEYEFHYSAGLQAVVLALGLCDSVDLYGFSRRTRDAGDHYYMSNTEDLLQYDYAAEYDFYEDLVQNKTIPFLTEAGISRPPVRIFT